MPWAVALCGRIFWSYQGRRGSPGGECAGPVGSAGGMNATEAAFQNGPAAKTQSHHWRQRATVRRLTPSRSDSCRRAALAPCCVAETSVTTAARYTLRPRNRREGGVARLRQPATAQQKLRRRSSASSDPAGRPRGLRRNRAEWSTPPHQLHPAARQSAAISSSMAKSSQ